VIRVLPSDDRTEAGFLDGTLLRYTLGAELVLCDIATGVSVRIHASPRDLLLSPDGRRIAGLDWAARELFVLGRESLQQELGVRLPAAWQQDESSSPGDLRWIVPNELVLVPKAGGGGVVDLNQRAATREMSFVHPLPLPEPPGAVALLTMSDAAPWGWRVSVWNARTGEMTRPVVLGEGVARLQALGRSRRFIALTLSGVEGVGRLALHVFDSRSGQRMRKVQGERVDWGGFWDVAVTAEGVVCASHSYPVRGGTCEGTALFDLRSMSIAKRPPGVRCVVREDEAMPAAVGSVAPGRVAIGSGGFGGAFGSVCNQALSADGRWFAQVESAPGWAPGSDMPEDLPSVLGHDLHLAVFDARTGRRQSDIALGNPPAGALDSLWIEFVSDTVVDVSTVYEATWRVDISTRKVFRGPGVLQAGRSKSGRWAWRANGVLFDFESGTEVAEPWWTDVQAGALEGVPATTAR
jgi:hypothetical protein